MNEVSQTKGSLRIPRRARDHHGSLCGVFERHGSAVGDGLESQTVAHRYTTWSIHDLLAGQDILFLCEHHARRHRRYSRSSIALRSWDQQYLSHCAVLECHLGWSASRQRSVSVTVSTEGAVNGLHPESRARSNAGRGRRGGARYGPRRDLVDVAGSYLRSRRQWQDQSVVRQLVAAEHLHSGDGRGHHMEIVLNREDRERHHEVPG